MFAVDTLHQGCGLFIPLSAAFKASVYVSMLKSADRVRLLPEIPLRRAQTTADLRQQPLRTRRRSDDALDPTPLPVCPTESCSRRQGCRIKCFYIRFAWLYALPPLKCKGKPRREYKTLCTRIYSSPGKSHDTLGLFHFILLKSFILIREEINWQITLRLMFFFCVCFLSCSFLKFRPSAK